MDSELPQHHIIENWKTDKFPSNLWANEEGGNEKVQQKNSIYGKILRQIIELANYLINWGT